MIAATCECPTVVVYGINWLNLVLMKNCLIIGNFWEQQEVTYVKQFVVLFDQRLTDAFIQNCCSVFENSSKCIVYKEIASQFCLQKYLLKRLSHKEKSLLWKYKISAHSINVENGRYNFKHTFSRDR